MTTKFLDKTGLSHFWSKIKAWCNAVFAPIVHNQASNTINVMTGYSKPNSGSAIASSDSLNNAIGKLEAKIDAINSSKFVKKSGDTMSGDLTISKTAPQFRTKNTSITRGISPASNTGVTEILGKDNADKATWALYHTYTTDKTHRIRLLCYNGLTTDSQYAEIGVGYDGSGDPYTNAPTPLSVADNSTKIATTAWVRKATGDFACNSAKSYSLTSSVTPIANGLIYSSGGLEFGTVAGKLYKGSSNDASLLSVPENGTYYNAIAGNIQNLRLSWAADGKFFTDIFVSPNNHFVWHRDVVNEDPYPWRRLVEENADGITAPTWNISIAGNAATATKLATARTINGASFDGSADITIADSTKLPLAGGKMTGDLKIETSTLNQIRLIAGNYGVLLRNDSSSFYILKTASGEAENGNFDSARPLKITLSTGICDINGNAANVSGTVAIDHGGTGATTRLNAVKALLNENVGTNAQCFLTTTNSWNKAGYTTVADIKTALGLKSAAYTESSAYVPLNNNYYIPGSKFFTYIVGSRGGVPNYVMYNVDMPEKGTAPSRKVEGIVYFGSTEDPINSPYDNKLAGMQEFAVNTEKTSQIQLVVYKWVYDSTSVSGVILECYQATTYNFRPTHNNSMNLGTSSTRWKDIYTNASAINGSDERIKDTITSVPDEVLDAWEDVNFVQFQMKDSIKEKGSSARFHNGLIAQRIDEAFKNHNLNVSKYGLFCHDTWDVIPEEKDNKGNTIREEIPAGDLYSLRYEEALCMEAAYQRRKNKILENRISELENRLAKLEGIMQ